VGEEGDVTLDEVYTLHVKRIVTHSFKVKSNYHNMCAKESSLHTYHLEN
jgi:hypothetical protein